MNTRTTTIRKIDVLSAAKLIGYLYAGIALVFSTLIFLGSLFGMFFSGHAITTLLMGLLALVGLPILYGILGFIVGAAGAALYNVVTRYTKGITVTVETTETTTV